MSAAVWTPRPPTAEQAAYYERVTREADARRAALAPMRAYYGDLTPDERAAYGRASDPVLERDADEREAHEAGVAAVEALRADVAAGDARARRSAERLRAAEQEAAAAAARREQRANESRYERDRREAAEIRAACLKYAREHPDDRDEDALDATARALAAHGALADRDPPAPRGRVTVAGMLLDAPAHVYHFPTRG